MIQKYIEEFKKQAPTGVSWLDALRKNSMARFEKIGFPTQRLEDWKDTNLTAITNAYFETPQQKTKFETKTDQAIWKNQPHVLFNNGFCESISVNVPGVSVTKFSDAIKDLPASAKTMLDMKPRYDHSILDLNTSLVQEGAFVHIQKDAQVEAPIYLVYQSNGSGKAFHYRNLILAEKFSKAKIVEIFLSEGDCWTVPVTQIQTFENANIEHVIIQDESLESSHTGVVVGRMEAHSQISTFSFSFGGKVVRNDIHMTLDGDGAQCVMDGLYAVSGNQIVDHHTAVDHAKPHCTSFENYRGVLMGDSHGVFQGKIFVAENAQKTDAKQMNQNLLLSSTAKVNTAPQLEILADDVKCAHGATIGKLDEDQVFYLRSRGIDLQTAKQMLVSAYADEVILKVSIPELHEVLQTKLSQKIGAA
jgi:Fe-S cluster assembly protein SufD